MDTSLRQAQAVTQTSLPITQPQTPALGLHMLWRDLSPTWPCDRTALFRWASLLFCGGRAVWTQEPDEHPSAPLGKALKPQRPLLNYGGLAEGSPWLPEAS